MAEAVMTYAQKLQLWNRLRESQENVVVARLMTAIENCLLDLGTSPEPDEVDELTRLCTALARHSAVQLAISNRTAELWDKVYRLSCGEPPQLGYVPSQGPGEMADQHSGIALQFPSA